VRVLAVEDDEGIASGLSMALRRDGCAVDVVATVSAAWSALKAERFDMVLLDLTLADGDGVEVLRRLRRCQDRALPNADTPVLIVTARDEVASLVSGLDMGADDYLTKPFHVSELTARMRALRRRSVGRALPVLRWANIEIVPAARSVQRGGQQIELTTREFDVLLMLLEASPRVLSRQHIESSLYSFDQLIESNAVEVHIHKLRRKLGDDVIQTMRGVGYFVPAAQNA
jgi:two-component system OmpR family response regulator/two-component system response regulator QseB